MSDRELGNVGSYVMVENDHVRVWQNDLEPGESSDWHLHTANYLFVATKHGDLKVEFDDDSSQVIEMQETKTQFTNLRTLETLATPV